MPHYISTSHAPDHPFQPDLNGELLDEQADEVHVLQDEVLRLQEAQSQLLQEDE